jgi:hypothetical protein
MIRSTTCAGHSILIQRHTASSASLNSVLLQTGQVFGKLIFFSLPFLTSDSDFYDLGDHIACPFDQNAVAYAQILFPLYNLRCELKYCSR